MRFATWLALSMVLVAPVLLAQTAAPRKASPPFPPAIGADGKPVVVPWAVNRRTGAEIPVHDEGVTPATPAPEGLYVAMGDSITFGQGVTDNCQSFATHPVDIASACPDGKSYAALVALAMRKAGIAGRFMNLGISGATVDWVIDDEMPYLPAETTLVTLYVGTNDARFVRRTGMSVAENVKQYESQYEKLLGMIHTRAPEARIVLVNIPNYQTINAEGNFAEKDPNDLERFGATSQIFTKFVDGHYPHYPVADTICQAYSYDMGVHFNKSAHPNEAGSALLADAVIHAITDKPAAPPSKCEWYDAATADALITTK